MEQLVLEIEKNIPLTKDVYKAVLKGNIKEPQKPGQFINIALDGKFLRRPISVCDYDTDSIDIIYKTVGAGTRQMSLLKAKDKLNVLTGLGNGYDLSFAGDNPLLIGGGAGIPPLYFLAKELLKKKKMVTVILGFNTASEIFYESEFAFIGTNVIISTADGTKGERGLVTDVFPQDYSYIYACGPIPMLKAVNRIAMTDAQFSFEERMGCGFGACMGCSMKTRNGFSRICKDGPIFRREEIIWED